MNPPASAATQPGQRFGNCRVVRPLGQGALGAVYLAIDETTGRPVALKLLRLSGDDAPSLAEASARFMAEAGIARRLVHPDIVAVLDAGEQEGRGWLAMELVPGGDLARYTQPARLLPEALVLRIHARLARALAHAHRQGVVHRDLKPSNVLIDWPTDTVKLADFGLARLADAEGTRTGLVLGSPAYMAPEQLAGAAPSPASDFYALGVTLYQLLAGRLPYDDASLGELLRQVATEPAPDIRLLRREASPALAELLAQLLSKRPAQRPQDGDRLAALLQALPEATVRG